MALQRLDVGTSGLVTFARRPELAARWERVLSARVDPQDLPRRSARCGAEQGRHHARAARGRQVVPGPDPIPAPGHRLGPQHPAGRARARTAAPDTAPPRRYRPPGHRRRPLRPSHDQPLLRGEERARPHLPALRAARARSSGLGPAPARSSRRCPATCARCSSAPADRRRCASSITRTRWEAAAPRTCRRDRTRSCTTAGACSRIDTSPSLRPELIGDDDSDPRDSDV